MIYVAFLRGVNVGGKNIINMRSLKVELERAGFANVRTYINSGNVIFEDNEADRRTIETEIEETLQATYGYQGKAIVRSQAEIASTIEHFPVIFSNPKWKHNIIFLGQEIDSPKILERFKLTEKIETNSYSPGVLYWSALWEYGTRSTMLKLSTRSEYQDMTVRSIGTIEKIHALMSRPHE